MVTSGEYADIFLSSDAMITDSGSFITEYQYVRKPLIILSRKERRYNKFSEKLVTSSYVVDGSDIKKIYDIIDDVLINRNDYLKDMRDNVCDEHLDFVHFKDSHCASDNIYDYIRSQLS